MNKNSLLNLIILIEILVIVFLFFKRKKCAVCNSELPVEQKVQPLIEPVKNRTEQLLPFVGCNYSKDSGQFIAPWPWLKVEAGNTWDSESLTQIGENFLSYVLNILVNDKRLPEGAYKLDQGPRFLTLDPKKYCKWWNDWAIEPKSRTVIPETPEEEVSRIFNRLHKDQKISPNDKPEILAWAFNKLTINNKLSNPWGNVFVDPGYRNLNLV